MVLLKVEMTFGCCYTYLRNEIVPAVCINSRNPWADLIL